MNVSAFGWTICYSLTVTTVTSLLLQFQRLILWRNWTPFCIWALLSPSSQFPCNTSDAMWSFQWFYPEIYRKQWTWTSQKLDDSSSSCLCPFCLDLLPQTAGLLWYAGSVYFPMFGSISNIVIPGTCDKNKHMRLIDPQAHMYVQSVFLSVGSDYDWCSSELSLALKITSIGMEDWGRSKHGRLSILENLHSHHCWPVVPAAIVNTTKSAICLVFIPFNLWHQMMMKMILTKAQK